MREFLISTAHGGALGSGYSFSFSFQHFPCTAFRSVPSICKFLCFLAPSLSATELAQFQCCCRRFGDVFYMSAPAASAWPPKSHPRKAAQQSDSLPQPPLGEESVRGRERERKRGKSKNVFIFIGFAGSLVCVCVCLSFGS